MSNEDNGEKRYVVVAGLNRPRLTKIISLFQEKLEETKSFLRAEGEALDKRFAVEVIPCLAALGSYNGEDGLPIRYLSNVIQLDDSPMIVVLDDDAFRRNLAAVLLVGYEWQEKDDEKIQAYFNASQLEVKVDSVKANPEFDTMHDEMEAFQTLDDELRERYLSDGIMGPGKMAKAIVDLVYQISARNEESTSDGADTVDDAEADQADENDKENARELVEVQPQQEEPEPADPGRSRYACRICRTILFGENHLAQDHIQNRHSFKKSGRSSEAATCQSMFCSEDVLAWLSPSGQDIEGKLTCPYCSHKVGHWKWAGGQCSCGTWVTPAIQIPISKVDIIAPDPSGTSQQDQHPAVIAAVDPVLPAT